LRDGAPKAGPHPAGSRTTIGRFKQVIGNGLHSQTDARQNAEIAVAVHILNRMLEFGRPTSIRIV